LTVSQHGRLNGVEALRGVAATLVVLYHAAELLGGAKSYGVVPFAGFWGFGRAGVDFFFVLSGFIITFVHARDLGHPASFGPFWRKRLLRIYPTWWVVLLAYGALLAISPTPDRSEQELPHILASALLMPETSDPIVGVGWSLRHELLFYALFSAVLLWRPAGVAIFAAWAGGILLNMWGQLQTGQPYFGGLAGEWLFRGFNLQFFFGIATAVVVRAGIGRAWRTAALCGAAGFLATGMTESFLPPVMHEWPVRTVMYATSAALVLYGVAMLDRYGQGRTPALLLRLGTASYSIYLVHVPVLLVLEYWLRTLREFVPIPAPLAFAGLVVLAVVIGVAFSETVEQPLLRLGRPRPRPCPEARPFL